MSPLGLTPARRDAARSLLGAQAPLREARGGVWGPPPTGQCSLSLRTHLPSQPVATARRQSSGTPGWGGQLREAVPGGVPPGWGGTPAVSPRGEGSRERQEGPPSGKPKCLAEAQERPHVRRLSPQGEVRAAGLVSERPALRAAGGALGSQGQSL